MKSKNLIRLSALALFIGASAVSKAQIGSPVTINVTPTPTATAPANQEYCGSSAVAALTFTGSAGVDSFQISGGSTVGLNNSTVTTASVPGFTAMAATSSDITATVSIIPFDNGCAGNAVTYTITIPAAATAIAPGDFATCAGSPVAATPFTASNADSFQVTGGGSGLADQTITTSEIPSFTAATTPNTYTVTITPFNNGCPGTAVSYTITINANPAVTVPNDFAVCSGAAINATFTGTGTTYNWTNNNTATGIAASGSGNISVANAASVATQEVSTITVTPVSGICTGTPATFNITVNGLPNGTLTAGDPDICFGEQAQLVFTGTAGNPVSIEYTINGGTVQTQTISSNPQTFNVGSPNTSNSYQLMTITDANTCERTN